MQGAKSVWVTRSNKGTHIIIPQPHASSIAQCVVGIRMRVPSSRSIHSEVNAAHRDPRPLRLRTPFGCLWRSLAQAEAPYGQRPRHPMFVPMSDDATHPTT
jgi:hypothetical protein